MAGHSPLNRAAESDSCSPHVRPARREFGAWRRPAPAYDAVAMRVLVGTSGFSSPDWRLTKRGAALCAAEVDPEEGSGAPYVRTARFTYVRLRRNGYDEAALAATFERIRTLTIETASVYFKHDELGPRHAESLLARASAA
jgi:hypothetical protein